MIDFSLIEEFVYLIEQTQNLKSLTDLFGSIIRQFGFDKHTCLSSVDLNHPPANSILIYEFPEVWVNRYKEKEYFKHDLVLKSIYREAKPLKWLDLEEMDDINQKIFYEAQQFGIRNGITIPLMMPGHYPCTINIAGEFVDVDPRAYSSLHLLSVHYFNQLLLLGQSDFAPPALTPRQKECLYWAAQGKSDSDIAEILAIRARTVNYHIEKVREKFDVRTRSQSIALAISCGLLLP